MDRAIKILLIITGIIAVVSVAFSGIVFYKNKNNQVGGIKQNELLIASNFGNESVAEKLNVKDWKTYRNEEYGFALGFPVSWDGYVINDKVLQTAYNHDQKKYSFHEIKFLYPQSKSKSGKSGDVYFSIGIFDRGNWSIGENDSWHKLGENNQFVFAGLPSLGAAPDELDERMREIPDIIESFKFIANTSDWKTYKNEEYGFEFKYPDNFFYYEDENLLSFQDKKYEKDGYEWPRFEIKIFKNDGLGLKKWLEEEWLALDKYSYKEGVAKKLLENVIVSNIDGLETSELHIDDYIYYQFINIKNKNVCKLTCAYFDENLDNVCKEAAITFKIIK